MTDRTTRYQAAILHGHQLLLLKVSELPSGRTFWVIPGGGREGHESAEECVRREVREETRLEVEVLGLLSDEPDPTSFYRVMKTYLCRVTDGVAAPGLEGSTIQAVAWFDLRAPSTWDALALSDPITFPLLQRLRSRLGYK